MTLFKRLERLSELNRVCDIDDLVEIAKQQEALLKEAAELFRFYEDSHRKRGPEHLVKADRNAEIATRIETALGYALTKGVQDDLSTSSVS